MTIDDDESSTDLLTNRGGAPPEDPAEINRTTRPPGTTVGAYVLGGLIEVGGFGAVFRAVHEELGTPAAIKLLHPHLVSRPEIVLRFEREIEVVKRLRHPNVVQILEHGRVEDGSSYLAMELLQGTTLNERLRQRGRLGAAEALAILEPLVSALEAAHAIGVIHRDIKASNVFIASQGGQQRVVLLDFGVAKLLDTTNPRLTGSVEIIGSFSCMSPEQYMMKPVDARTDVYGLAVLTYRMLVGELPFQSAAFMVMRELHLRVAPPPPSTRGPVDPRMDHVILKAMSKSPDDRYPSVRAFLDAFRAVAEAPSAREKPAGEKRRALAAYVEVSSPAGLSDDMLDDLSTIADELTAAGLMVMVETSSSVLLSIALPNDSGADVVMRRKALNAGFAVFRAITRSKLRMFFNVGELLVTPEGNAVGGDLLEVARWVPDAADLGVFAYPAVIQGLGITRQMRFLLGGSLLCLAE